MRRLFVALITAVACYTFTRWMFVVITPYALPRSSIDNVEKLIYAVELAGVGISALVATLVCRRPVPIGLFTWLLPIAFALPYISHLPASWNPSFVRSLAHGSAWFLGCTFVASQAGAWLGLAFGVNRHKPNNSFRPNQLRGSA